MRRRAFSLMLYAMALLPCLLVSNAAQAFILETLNEQRVNFMDYVEDDRWTLVMIWATDCIPCEEQKPALEAFYQKHSAAGEASVLGLVLDGRENREEMEKLNELHNPTYTNLVLLADVFHDQFQTLVGKDFRTTPTFLVFDNKGGFRGTFNGYLPFEQVSGLISTQN